jgi:hypothetical protein
MNLIRVSITWGVTSDLCLVPANVRVLLGLVTTRSRHACDGARVPPLTIQVPPATARVPPSTIWVPPATVRVTPLTVRVPPMTIRVPRSTVWVPSATVIMPPLTIWVLSVTVEVPPLTARVLPPTVEVPMPTAEKALAVRGVDHGGHRSQHMDLHAGSMVGANYRGL